MVEISKSGSGEGSVWVTGRGYSTRDQGSGIRDQSPQPPVEQARGNLRILRGGEADAAIPQLPKSGEQAGFTSTDLRGDTSIVSNGDRG